MNSIDKLKEIQQKMKDKGVIAKFEISKKKSTHQGAVYVKKGGQGGVRENAGKPALPAEALRKTLKNSWREFGAGEVEVKVRELHKGNVQERMVKMARLKVVQEALFKKTKEGDVAAIKEFNDRVFNKSAQPLVGDNDDDPIQVQHLGVSLMLHKVYGGKNKPE